MFFSFSVPGGCGVFHVVVLAVNGDFSRLIFNAIHVAMVPLANGPTDCALFECSE